MFEPPLGALGILFQRAILIGAALTNCASVISKPCGTFSIKPRSTTPIAAQSSKGSETTTPPAWMSRALCKKGIEPIEPELDRIAAMQDKSGMANEVARLHAKGADVLFRFGSGQDLKNFRVVIAQADQGGLGLPDRPFYFKKIPEKCAKNTWNTCGGCLY